MALRRVCVAGCVGVLSTLCAASALAAPRTAAHRIGRIRGIVPIHSRTGKIAASGGNSIYHSGPVMHANTVRAIYWIPAVPHRSSVAVGN